jgi:uncharacterized protein (UPF0332 family)
MDATDFITFASQLAVQTNPTPPQCRSAVSRAYYGAFHSAMNFLAGLGHSCPIHNAHVWVVEMFGNCNVDEAVEISGLLDGLRLSRREADYDLAKVAAETKSNAMLRVERAKDIESRLDRCSAVAISTRIKAGVAAHRKKIPGR